MPAYGVPSFFLHEAWPWGACREPRGAGQRGGETPEKRRTEGDDLVDQRHQVGGERNDKTLSDKLGELVEAKKLGLMSEAEYDAGML